MDHTGQEQGAQSRKESIAIKSHKMIVAKTKIVTAEIRYILMAGLIINIIH